MTPEQINAAVAKAADEYATHANPGSIYAAQVCGFKAGAKWASKAQPNPWTAHFEPEDLIHLVLWAYHYVQISEGRAVEILRPLGFDRLSFRERYQTDYPKGQVDVDELLAAKGAKTK